MTSTLFQNILPEDIPVMLKRLNAYTKSYQKEEYIKQPVILRISSALSNPAPFTSYRTIITATAISPLLSPRIPCLGRLLPVQEFHIFPWILWQQRTVQ